MDWTEASKEHFAYIRSLPMTHLKSGLDYNLKQVGNTLYVVFAETNALKYDNDWSDNLNYLTSRYHI